MRVERRLLLRLPFAAAGAWMLGHLAGCGRRRDLGFDELAAEMGRLATALRAAEVKDEEAYLRRVAALAERLDHAPEASFGALFKGVIATSLAYRGSWLALVQWRMEANAAYPAHDHPNYNQVTVGVEGECKICHYQPVGELPPRASREPFEVVRTQENVLIPGAVTSLFSTRRDNIHELEAGPAGARGIDLMTLVGAHEGFSFVEVERAAGVGGTHRARWGEHLKK